MGDVLAFAEQRDGTIRGVARETVTAASGLAGELGGEVHAVAVGPSGLAGEAGSLGGYGASRVRVGELDALGVYDAEVYTATVLQAVREGDYRAVLFPATAQGRDLAPRVAASLDVPLATDVTELRAADDQVTVVRPVYAGKAFATVKLDGSPAVVSLRPNTFQPEPRGDAVEAETFVPEADPSSSGARVVEFEPTGAGMTDVAEASIVVSGGRGMRDPDNWGLLEDLRDAIGPQAALGASRAVVDAGWRPHGEQVGQTGKTVSPKLYFAVGISGAIQHLAGMRTAGTIVAINKDPEAPIFEVADYGIVGDLFDVVPALTGAIESLKEGD